MPANILITGAAGYIGGSLVADFLADDGLIGKQHIYAAVRSEEQAKAISKSGLNVIQLDLSDEKAVLEILLKHEIHIIIQTASAINFGVSLPLITALGKRREISGEATYYIHTSGLSAFFQQTGWPESVSKDTGPMFEVEKELADSYPIRKTDVAVIEHAKAKGVTSFIVVPANVYGKGTGEWNKLSVIFPVYIGAIIAQKRAHKFSENITLGSVHISDMTALYGRIVERILRNETPPSGTEGYYIALANDLSWWEVIERLTAALKARGLVTETEIPTWPSYEVAAQALGVPAPFVQPLWDAGTNIVSERAYSIGWSPKWSKERFFENIDDEINNVIELGQAKSSLIESLFKAVGGQ